MSTQSTGSKRFLPVKEAAEYLGLSPNTLYSWFSQGLYLPVVRMGRRVFVEVADLDRFVASRKQMPDFPEGISS